MKALALETLHYLSMTMTLALSSAACMSPANDSQDAQTQEGDLRAVSQWESPTIVQTIVHDNGTPRMSMEWALETNTVTSRLHDSMGVPDTDTEYLHDLGSSRVIGDEPLETANQTALELYRTTSQLVDRFQESRLEDEVPYECWVDVVDGWCDCCGNGLRLCCVIDNAVDCFYDECRSCHCV